MLKNKLVLKSLPNVQKKLFVYQQINNIFPVQLRPEYTGNHKQSFHEEKQEA